MDSRKIDWPRTGRVDPSEEEDLVHQTAGALMMMMIMKTKFSIHAMHSGKNFPKSRRRPLAKWQRERWKDWHKKIMANEKIKVIIIAIKLLMAVRPRHTPAGVGI